MPAELSVDLQPVIDGRKVPGAICKCGEVWIFDPQATADTPTGSHAVAVCNPITLTDGLIRTIAIEMFGPVAEIPSNAEYFIRFARRIEQEAAK